MITARGRNAIDSLYAARDFRVNVPGRIQRLRYPTPAALERAISDGRLDLGVVVPHEFARQLGRGQTADVQVLINGVNANTAQLAQGHVQAAVAWVNQKPGVVAPVELRTALLYNPGLENTWFTVTGVMGALIVLNCSLVAATALIR